MTLTLLTPATTFPVTLVEAKEFARVTHNDEDMTMNTCIRGATRHIERELDLSISQQQWLLTEDAFSSEIGLQNGPVISVDEFTYLDADGVSQTVDPGLYTLDGDTIYLNSGSVWPATSQATNAVSVTYTTGFDVQPDDDLKIAIMGLAAHWFNQRETVAIGSTVAEVPFFVDALMQNYRKVLV